MPDMMIAKFKDREWLLSKAILFVISVIFLMFVAISTSPLTAFYGWDSAFFMLVGQGMTEGMIPYRDFFDMKGPFMFFVEYLGQLLSWGRNGCFLMEVIHLTVSLWIIDETYRSAASNKYSIFRWLCFIPVLLVASFSFEDGNLTEEYSLPWLLYSVHLVLQYFRNAETSRNYQHPVWMGFYHGIVFGFMTMIRINNAAFIGAILLCVTIGLITSKQFLNILHNGIAFILGTIAVLIPFFLWYASKGLLQEMLDQVFFFGVQYSSQTGFINKLYLLYNIRYMLLPALVPVVILVIFRVRSWRIWLMSIVSMLIGVFAVSMGFGLVHYITLLIPNLVFGLSLLLQCIHTSTPAKKQRHLIAEGIVISIFLCIMCVMMIQTPDVAHVYERKNSAFTGKEWDIYAKEQADEIVQQIPEDERNSVYAYGVNISCSKFYAMAGLYPPIRYCDWQQSYIDMREEIGQEIANWLDTECRWVVSQRDYQFAPQLVADSISKNFTHVYSNGEYSLYKAVRQE